MGRGGGDSRKSTRWTWAQVGTTARARYAWVLDLKDAHGARTPPDPPRHLFNLELETRF